MRNMWSENFMSAMKRYLTSDCTCTYNMYTKIAVNTKFVFLCEQSQFSLHSCMYKNLSIAIDVFFSKLHLLCMYKYPNRVIIVYMCMCISAETLLLTAGCMF